MRKLKTAAQVLVGGGGWGQLTETRRRVGGDDFVFSHTENSTVSDGENRTGGRPDLRVRTAIQIKDK